MGEKIVKLVGYAIAFLVFAFILWVAHGEVENEKEANRIQQEQLMQQCVDNGGDIEVKQGDFGGWSCHLPNEALRDE